MAYEIHIQRVNKNGESVSEQITLSEWKTAVENQQNIRLISDEIIGTNSVTREIIRISNSDGTAEIFFPDESKWYRIYRWNKGVIPFKGLPSSDNPNDTVRQMTQLLAKDLEAKIVGDADGFYE